MNLGAVFCVGNLTCSFHMLHSWPTQFYVGPPTLKFLATLVVLSLISAKLSQIKKDSCQYCPKPHFSKLLQGSIYNIYKVSFLIIIYFIINNIRCSMKYFTFIIKSSFYTSTIFTVRKCANTVLGVQQLSLGQYP